jgi:hypothetical protein
MPAPRDARVLERLGGHDRPLFGFVQILAVQLSSQPKKCRRQSLSHEFT